MSQSSFPSQTHQLRQRRHRRRQSRPGQQADQAGRNAALHGIAEARHATAAELALSPVRVPVQAQVAHVTPCQAQVQRECNLV